jgi:hypothetical protein
MPRRPRHVVETADKRPAATFADVLGQLLGGFCREQKGDQVTTTFFSAVGWIATASGRAFNVLTPNYLDIDIEDVAAPLSKQCRYGGHTKRFYSVAEHCVHVARYAPKPLKLEALLHDGSEAYLLDIPRPIKKAMPEYRTLEDNLMAAVAARFGIHWPVDPEVTDLDNRILHDEVAQAMVIPPVPWGIPGEPLGVELQFWTPDQACAEFLAAFRHYCED